jgi:hypothetical protein
MAYAFTKLDEYLRGRNGGASLPGSQSIGKGATLPAGGGAQASKGVPQSAGASTGRAILEKAGSEGTDETINRIVRPASQQAQNMQAKIGEGGKNWFTEQQQNIKDTYAAPKDVSNVVSSAAGGDTDAQNTLRGGMTIKPYVPPKPPEQAIEALQPSQYLQSGNVGNYLQKTSGGRYTPGMGLIDAMQMNKNRAGAGVAQIMGDLQTGVRDAYAQTAQYTPQLETQAKTAQEETQKAIREAIQGKQTQLNEVIQAALAKQQATQNAIDAEERGGAMGALNKIGQVPNFDDYMGATTVQKQFEDPSIGQYNTLAGILGGDMMTNPMYNDVNYSPDEAALLDFLRKGKSTASEPTPEPVMLPDGTPANQDPTFIPLPGGGVSIPGGEVQASTEPMSPPINRTSPPPVTGVEPGGILPGEIHRPTTPQEVPEGEGSPEGGPIINPLPDEPMIGSGGGSAPLGSDGTGSVLGSAAQLGVQGVVSGGDWLADMFSTPKTGSGQSSGNIEGGSTGVSVGPTNMFKGWNPVVNK